MEEIFSGDFTACMRTDCLLQALGVVCAKYTAREMISSSNFRLEKQRELRLERANVSKSVLSVDCGHLYSTVAQ